MECYPVAKVGGLADVVGALPKYLNKIDGVEAAVIMPWYNKPFVHEHSFETVFDGFKANAKGGKRSGAGLGLSIVESFVTLHNGDVSIDSRAGQGTVVTCRIPVGSRARSVAAE